MSTPTSEGQTVSIGRLHVPLLLVVSGLVAAIAASGTVWGVIAHSRQTTAHLNEQEVINGGGVAYKAEVRALETSFEKRMVEEHRRTRKMMAGAVWKCRKAGDTFTCTVSYIPEVE